jgi:hypothetical protein
MRLPASLIFASIASATLAAGVTPPPSQGGSGAAAQRVLAGPDETTDWMATAIAEDTARQFRKDGRAMTTIDCRSNANLDVDSGEGTEFRFTSVVNDARIEWTWREFPSPDMKSADRKLSDEGYRLVMSQEFQRLPSGQKRTCALWHK